MHEEVRRRGRGARLLRGLQETLVMAGDVLLAVMFALIAGFQSLFFAMWFDMEVNKHLK